MKKKWWKKNESRKEVISKISTAIKASRPSWNSVFSGRYEKTENGCFIYTGLLSKNGYGRISFKGKVVGSHRLSFELKNGFINDRTKFVCHTCDNPACINPEHLWLGTHTESMNNIMEKNRGSISRLSPEQKNDIKKSYPQKNIIELSVQYGVPTRVISFIIKTAHLRLPLP
jgi:hypothetical protein